MENLGIRLPIKNSSNILYVSLGLFSAEGDLEQFMKSHNLAPNRAFFDESLAKEYCKRARNAGLIAEIQQGETK